MLIDVDIPILSSSGIQFSYNSFQYTYSLQSSSNHSLFSSSFDAPALSAYIMSTSQYVQLTEDSTDLIIPNGKYNANDVTSFNISNNMNLKSIMIGNSCFGNVREFELNGLSELESVVI